MINSINLSSINKIYLFINRTQVSIIETVNDELKNICQIEHSRHRSFTNFLSNLVSELIIYRFSPKKTTIKYQTCKSKQLIFY